MSARKPVTSKTLEAVSSELAGEPFDANKAKEHEQIFETIMGMIETLRELPIKEVEPALVFQPVEEPKRSSS